MFRSRMTGCGLRKTGLIPRQVSSGIKMCSRPAFGRDAAISGGTESSSETGELPFLRKRPALSGNGDRHGKCRKNTACRDLQFFLPVRTPAVSQNPYRGAIVSRGSFDYHKMVPFRSFPKDRSEDRACMIGISCLTAGNMAFCGHGSDGKQKALPKKETTATGMKAVFLFRMRSCIR